MRDFVTRILKVRVRKKVRVIAIQTQTVRYCEKQTLKATNCLRVTVIAKY